MSVTIEQFLALPIPPVQPPKLDADTVFHVGVSGGKDSAAVLLWMVRESGINPSKIVASFCDISNDHPWTIEHIKLLSKTVHPIEFIYPKQGFFELALGRKRFPSSQARFCTEELKIFPTIDKIQALKATGKKVVAVTGVRAGESPDRAKLPEWDFSGNLLCIEWRPLLRWDLSDVFSIHKRHAVPLNPLYAIGAQRVGCWPCIMSRKEEIREIALRFPERIDEIRKMENALEDRVGYSGFFSADKVPKRFRSKPIVCADGRKMNVATIDDVVKWSMTGKRARGSFRDDPKSEPLSCNSGYCE